MIYIDMDDINDLKENILKNTNVEEVNYVNKYDNNYIVKDYDYVYLFNSNYEEIYKIKLDLLYDNLNNYDLIYRNNTIMYMDNYRVDDGIVFRYYDIYTYELIDEIVVGDN